MGILRKAALAAVGLLLTAGSVTAQTTVKWLHIEVNPNQVKIWEEVARTSGRCTSSGQTSPFASAARPASRPR